jgi:hypothetical protein
MMNKKIEEIAESTMTYNVWNNNCRKGLCLGDKRDRI